MDSDQANQVVTNVIQLAQAEILAMQQTFASQQAAAHESFVAQQQAANETLASLRQQLQSVQEEAAHQVNALQEQLAAAQNTRVPPHLPHPSAAVAADVELPRALRLPALDTFEGRTGEDLEAFLFQLHEYLEIAGVKDDVLRVRVAGMSLRGAAKTWYTYVRSPFTPASEQVKTYEEFLSGIKAHFTPIDPVKLARDQLAVLKQTGSVRDYTATFRQLNTRIPKMSEDERLDRYVRGLKPRTRKEVEIREPSTYDEAIRIAEKFDVAFDRAYATDLNGRSNRSEFYQPPRSLPTYSTAYNDSDASGFADTSDPMILNSIQVTSQDKKGPLSQDEKDRRKRLGLCAYCGDEDHDIDQCTLRPRSGGRHMRPRGAQ